ncbi:MAG: tetratricopeptide repeat protein [Deltaproteobacteria bacterium]|nr:tetratricopeptide repeat protein [Deltaproteobacteria bacterium]
MTRCSLGRAALWGRLVAAAAAGLVVCLACAVARAGEDDAKTFFAEGRRLRQSGQCEAAVAQFQRALEAYPQGLGALRNIAECQQELGRYAAARRAWWDLRRAVLQSGEARYVGWDQDAERAYGQLAGKVARLVVRVVGPGAAGARLVLDGEPVAPALLGAELERDPGVHQLELRGAGTAVQVQAVPLHEAERLLVTLHAAAAGKAGSDARGGAAEPPPAGHSWRTGGYVALGLGGAGLVGLVASLAVRQNALGDLEEVCPSYDTAVCSPAANEPVSRGQTASMLVNVFGVVAGAGAAAGATLLAVDALSGPVGSASVARLTLQGGPTSGGVTLGIRF